MRLLLVALLGVVGMMAQRYEGTWQSIDKCLMLMWFTEAKFGIFIHWEIMVPAYAPVIPGSWRTRNGIGTR